MRGTDRSTGRSGTVEPDPQFAADMPEAVRTVLLDERVEAFIWPEEVQTSAGTPKDDRRYAFECNYGEYLQTSQFGSRMDFSWGADACGLNCSHCSSAVVGHVYPEVEPLWLLTCLCARM